MEPSEPVISLNGGCFAQIFIVSIQYTASTHVTFRFCSRNVARKGRIRNEKKYFRSINLQEEARETSNRNRTRELHYNFLSMKKEVPLIQPRLFISSLQVVGIRLHVSTVHAVIFCPCFCKENCRRFPPLRACRDKYLL